MTQAALERLTEYLENLPSGVVDDEHRGKIENLLFACWGEFDNETVYEGMSGWKLPGRTEDMSWNPPQLKFSVERHGSAVLGSVYADIQEWLVDLDRRTVRGSTSGRRLVRKRAPPLNVKHLVDEIIELVAAGEKNRRLTWESSERVRVEIGQIIPSESAVQQTLEGRRRRFAKLLEAKMKALGWEKVLRTRHHTYQRHTNLLRERI